MDVVNAVSDNDEEALKSVEAAAIKEECVILKRIYDIWKEFNIEESQKAQRAKAVWGHVLSLLEDIHKEEESFLNDIKERIEIYNKKIEDLCKALLVTPATHKEAVSLIRHEEALRFELDTLKRVKHNREKEYKDLRSTEANLCRILNLKEHQLPTHTAVPSENDLKELEQHIDMLKREKEKRYKKVCLVRKELTIIMEETDLTPETALEKDLLSGNDSVLLTNETLEKLGEVVKKAQQKKAELESQKEFLLSKLTVLWQRLKTDKEETEKFLNKHSDCRLSTLQSIERELDRCEKIKQENLQMFVDSLRQELNQLWKKCCLSDRDKASFQFYTETEMSDTLLCLHEAEVEKWKKYYQEAEGIFSNIQKRQLLWDQLVIFENKATDPNRFKNRKGNLLQEERVRKKLQKDLPALENKIFQEIEAYKLKTGRSFLYYGEDYEKYVADQWSERNNQKENEKMERHQKHKLQLENEITGCTPAKRAMATPKSAPSKLLKSSMPMSTLRTPAAHCSKKAPHTVGKSMAYRLFESKLGVPTRQKLVLAERNGQVATKGNGSSSDKTTYSEFAAELNRTARKTCRSSVLCTKKPGGTRTSGVGSQSKKKNSGKSLRRSMRISASKTNTLSVPESGNVLTPARGKLGLPFLI